MHEVNTFRHPIDLERAGSGTHLRKRFESLNLNLISKLTMPIGWLVAPKMLAADVERIKARLENPT